MTYLLDTHVLLWSQLAPQKLGKKCKQVLSSSASRFVSTVSALEIARLVHKGHVRLALGVEPWFAQAADAMDAGILALDLVSAVGAYELPGLFHPDPADRMLVATARASGLTLVTADHAILAYPHARCLDATQ